jgi:hypothetical protein
MKRLPLLFLSLSVALLIQPTFSGASERGDEFHAVVVDFPEEIDMSYASPESWKTLPPPKKFYVNPPIPILEPDEIDLPMPTQQPTYLAALP